MYAAFSPDGSRIAYVRAHNLYVEPSAGDAPPRIEVRCERRDDAIVLRVRDHGIGFDPKYSEQVFRVFRRLQRKLPGTGIGLAICKKIVERHGGTIEAHAIPGEGATFQVTLPRIEVHA